MDGGAGGITQELNIRFHGYFFGNENIWITETTINMWIIGGAMILFALVLRSMMGAWNPGRPSGVQNAVEALVEVFNNYVKSITGEKYAYFGNYFFTVFLFIMLSNLSGLVLLRNPTADLAVTFALSFLSFFIIHLMGIVHSKGEYFKGFISPHPVMLPLNLIGELTPAISLSFRLFGAVVGGFVVSTLIYNLAPVFMRVGLPIIIHAYFDVFGGILHAFIFVTLSMVFLKNKLPGN